MRHRRSSLTVTMDEEEGDWACGGGGRHDDREDARGGGGGGDGRGDGRDDCRRNREHRHRRRGMCGIRCDEIDERNGGHDDRRDAIASRDGGKKGGGVGGGDGNVARRRDNCDVGRRTVTRTLSSRTGGGGERLRFAPEA